MSIPISRVVIEVEGYQRLLELDVVRTLEGLSESVLDSFCHFLFTGFDDITPPSHFDVANRAGDHAVVCRIIWDDEFIAAALLAAKRKWQLQPDGITHAAIVQTNTASLRGLSGVVIETCG
jgi:hypothetical protein